MNLLIVDDEPHIVDWMYELLQQEMPQMTLFRAYSGVQAVSILEKNRIDLLMSDIRMPKMSGLRLMELVRERWPDCRILFLTGYGEFDYVYAAIQQRGVRYLLKAEDDAVILSTIREMEQELRQEDPFVRNQVERFVRRERAINALLRREMPDEALYEALEFSPEARLCMIWTRAEAPGILPAGMAAQKLAEQALSGFCLHPLQISLRDGSAVWVGEVTGETDWTGGAQVLAEALKREGASPVQTVALRTTATLTGLADALTAFSRFAGERPFQAGVSLLESLSESRDPRRELELQRRLLIVQSMCFMLQRGDREAYMRNLSEALAGLADAPLEDSLCREVYLALAIQLTGAIEQSGLAPLLPGELSLSALCAPDRFGSWSEAFEFCRKLAAELLRLSENPQEREEMGMAARLTSYIEGHLQEDLSLASLAERWHYNPSYLSRAFKQQTGVNLNAYIMQARLKRACELLRHSDDRISEIAEKVGFRDPRHFAEVFRRQLGLPPQAYRNGGSK